ncbi:MAG: sigma factor, partial [Pseudomonadota bacterium]
MLSSTELGRLSGTTLTPRVPSRIDTSEMASLLARIAQDRDARAFADLYDTYVARLRSYMLRQGADGATAEELAQETMLTVWRKAHLYSSEKGSASTWIYTIARNLRIDRLRKETPWQELPEG